MLPRYLMLASSMLAMPSLVHATPADAPAAADQKASEAGIIVTGSRVIANGNNSPAPVTVIGVEQVLQSQPVPVAQALQNLPVFSGSQGQNSAPGGASANGSANVMNLRNMGLLRSLVLYDGHRVPPTSPQGYVDTNMIPQMLLKRVDMVTGGASAVYGSDAVSGVVNFITDSKFNGLRFDAQAGVSNYGDDKTQKLAVAIGTPAISRPAMNISTIRAFSTGSTAHGTAKCGPLAAREPAPAPMSRSKIRASPPLRRAAC